MKEPAEEESPTGSLHQRTLPPSGRVTTLVPLPFFFRRAFIMVEIKIKYKDYCIVEKIDGETRKAYTSGNKVRYFRVIDVGRIADIRILQEACNRSIRNSSGWERVKLTILKTTYLDEVNLESRTNTPDNNMNLCHSKII